MSLIGQVAAARRRHRPELSLDGRLGADGRDFICFEPMAGITNALNLAHKGLYKELQSVPPGGTWQESFWVKPSGFQ